MTDDQKAIDVAESLRDKAEQLSEAAGELRALSVNVMNLVELVRAQHEAMEYVALVVPRLMDIPRFQGALAKYNDVMGEGNELLHQ